MTKPTALTKAADVWEWTEERERCLQMLMRGFPKRQIADELGVHPNTITNWSKNPAFVRRLNEELTEFQTASRLRHIRQESAALDAVGKLALKALQEAEKPSRARDFKTINISRAWLAELRAFRQEERLNFGESTNNVTTINHHQGSVSLGNRSFKEFMEEQLKAGVINAEIVSAQANPQEALIEAVQQVLIEGEVLREYDKEFAKQKGEYVEPAATDVDIDGESA